MHIKLNNLLFNAHIGVFEQEQAVGAQYSVNLDVEMPETDGMRNDMLDGTVSYADLFDIIRTEMSRPCALLENAAYRILESIRNRFVEIRHATISITKLSPPIAHMHGSATIEMCY